MQNFRREYFLKVEIDIKNTLLNAHAENKNKIFVVTVSQVNCYLESFYGTKQNFPQLKRNPMSPKMHFFTLLNIIFAPLIHSLTITMLALVMSNLFFRVRVLTSVHCLIIEFSKNLSHQSFIRFPCSSFE